MTQLLQGGVSVVLTGPAGLGKTRLAAAVAHEWAADGGAVHRVVASPAGLPIPLAPFADLVGNAVGADAVLAARGALAEAARRVAAGGQVRPALLVVDDLQLLDEASATVLHQLLVGGGILVLSTYRTASTSAPTALAVERVRQSPGVEHVDVPPLTDADIAQMTEGALGAPLAGHARSVLVRAAAGNPLYARELVEGSVAGKALVPHLGVYDFVADLVATPLLEEVVLARLAPLGQWERTALELLALGGRLPQELVERVVGFPALERLEREGLVDAETVPAAGRTSTQVLLDVAHPLYRELTRARLGPLARMRIHRTLAEADAVAIERNDTATSPGAGQPDAADGPWADHRLRSITWAVRGGLPVGPQLLMAAAERAAVAGDSPLALELAMAAHRALPSSGAGLVASRYASMAGAHEDSVALLREALDLEADPWRRTEIRLRIAEELLWLGRMEQAHTVVQEAEPGPWEALLQAQGLVHAVLAGDNVSGRTAAAALTGHDHEPVRYLASVAHGIASLHDDDAAATVAVCAPFLEPVDAQPTALPRLLVGDRSQHRALQILALTQLGQVSAARELAEAAYQRAQALPSAQDRAWASMQVGFLSLLTGDLARAAATLAESDRVWAATGVVGFAVPCAAALGRVQAERGFVEDAQESLDRAQAYPRPPRMLNDYQLRLTEAWLAVRRGDRAAAAATLSRCVAQLGERGEVSNAHEVWHEAARLDVLDLLDAPQLPRPRDPLLQARWDFVRARLDGDAPALERSAERFAEFTAMRFAAEAAACAVAAYRRSGKAREATRLEGLTGGYLAGSGSHATPLLAPRTGAGPLSAREREIADLAAQGLSNKRIAEHLVVSERTVENHLYRVFIKLGVTGRELLADALAELT